MDRVVQVRLPGWLHDAVRVRARRRKVANSVALRELVGLGLMVDRAEAHGVVVTDAARELLTGDAPALVQFGIYGDDEPIGAHDVEVLGLDDDQVAALERGGALVICTPEQLRELER